MVEMTHQYALERELEEVHFLVGLDHRFDQGAEGVVLALGELPERRQGQVHEEEARLVPGGLDEGTESQDLGDDLGRLVRLELGELPPHRFRGVEQQGIDQGAGAGGRAGGGDERLGQGVEQGCREPDVFLARVPTEARTTDGSSGIVPRRTSWTAGPNPPDRPTPGLRGRGLSSSSTSADSGLTSGNIPSNDGSMRRIRTVSGGWVERAAVQADTPLPKNMWQACSAFGLLIREPSASPPIFLSAPAMPAGFRVNCTAEASARNSRWRETAHLISRPKKTPT